MMKSAESANTEHLSCTSVHIICHQPNVSVFFFCFQTPLLKMGMAWNIQEAIYMSTIIWDRNGKEENI